MIKGETNMDGNSIIDLKNEVARSKTTKKKQQITQIDEQLTEDLKNCAIQARDKGASTWLNAVPWEDQNYYLNNNDLRDAIRLQYNLKLHYTTVYVKKDSMFRIPSSARKEVLSHKGMTILEIC